MRVGDVVSWHLPLAGYYTGIGRPRGRIIHIDGEWACVHRRVHLGIAPYVTKHLNELRLEEAYDAVADDPDRDLPDTDSGRRSDGL